MSELVTTAEAAKRLKLKPITLEIWRMRKKGWPFVRIGGRQIRYRVEDIEAHIKARVVRPKGK